MKHSPLSHSARQDFLACARAFHLGRNLRLEPNTQSSGRRMGKMFADALEHGCSTLNIEAEYDAVLGAIPEGSPEWEKLRLELAQLRILVPMYERHYRGSLNAPGLTVSVEHEKEFRHPILGHGFLDAVYTLEGKGIRTYIGREDKLLAKGFWRNADEAALAIDAQVTAYFAAMRDEGMPLEAMHYRTTFKPGIGRDGRRGEKWNEYEDRLALRLDKEPEYAFKEYMLVRSDKDIDAFIRRVQLIDKQVRWHRRMEKALGSDAWPANMGASCKAYGGCQFLPLCRGEATEDDYRVRPLPPQPLTRHEGAILRALSGAMVPPTTADIARQAGLPVDAVRYALRKLEQSDIVASRRVGRTYEWVLA